MHFWYDYVKPNYRDKAKLCYMDTDSFIFHVKTDDLKQDLTLHIMKQIDRCLSGKNEQVIELIKMN